MTQYNPLAAAHEASRFAIWIRLRTFCNLRRPQHLSREYVLDRSDVIGPDPFQAVWSESVQLQLRVGPRACIFGPPEDLVVKRTLTISVPFSKSNHRSRLFDHRSLNSRCSTSRTLQHCFLHKAVPLLTNNGENVSSRGVS